MLNIKNTWFLLLPAVLHLAACSKMSGPAALFKKQSPHDVYADNLKAAGLERTELGRQWLTRANNVAASALAISIPYKETGYFAPDKTQVVTLSFEAKKGQKINIALTKKPTVNFKIYMDVFEHMRNGIPKRVAFADTTGTALEYEIENAGKYYLRLQPELLSGGQYTLSITAGPSLGFPLPAAAKPRIGSFFGDGRDEGERLHEGIDIFAPKHTPAIAAANGIVTSVQNNKLGGKVVFMRPDDKDYTLYYAHLDAQLVGLGQTVRLGDTLGLVGNTGNARNTQSHLHFGIYARGGAVDPVYFIDRETKMPPQVTASLSLLNATARTNRKVPFFYGLTGNKKQASLEEDTPVIINAATGSRYKVTLPDGSVGYVDEYSLKEASALHKLKTKNNTVILNTPDSVKGLPIAAVNAGQTTEVLGTYKNYRLIRFNDVTGWMATDNK